MKKFAPKQARFRFYEELNDFLPAGLKKKAFPYRFSGKPSIKDAIEAIGVPHTEVDLILENGGSVGFRHHLRDGDRVSVYPSFESLDITPLVKLRAKPLRKTAFVLDVHLGALARILRMLGFDASYRNDYGDAQLVKISVSEKRILLTRDKTLLKNGSLTHAYWLRSTDPEEQAREVLDRFDLHRNIRPFERCLECNGKIQKVEKSRVLDQLETGTAATYDEFFQCKDCRKVYWKGSHYKRLERTVEKLISGKKRIIMMEGPESTC
jgi:uncharacterized protein with PIN domain